MKEWRCDTAHLDANLLGYVFYSGNYPGIFLSTLAAYLNFEANILAFEGWISMGSIFSASRMRRTYRRLI